MLMQVRTNYTIFVSIAEWLDHWSQGSWVQISVEAVKLNYFTVTVFNEVTQSAH